MKTCLPPLIRPPLAAGLVVMILFVAACQSMPAPRVVDGSSSSVSSSPRNLRIITVEDVQSTAVTLQLWLPVGASDESADQVGLARATQRLLLESWAHPSLKTRLDKLGVQFNGWVQNEATVFTAIMPLTSVQSAIPLFCKTLMGQAFEKVTEQTALKSTRRVPPDLPERAALQRLLALAYGQQKEGRAVVDATSSSFSLKAIKAFHEIHYSGLGAVAVVIGPDEAKQAGRLVSDGFEGWNKETPSAQPVETGQQQPRVYLERDERIDAHVYLAYRFAGSTLEETARADLLVRLLTGSNGLIARRLIDAGIENSKVTGFVYNPSPAAQLVLHARVPRGSIDSAWPSILQTLSELSVVPPTETSVSSAQGSLLRQLDEVMAHPEGAAQVLGQHIFAWQSETDLSNWRKGLRGTRPETISRVAANLLASKNLTALVTVPTKLHAVNDQLWAETLLEMVRANELEVLGSRNKETLAKITNLKLHIETWPRSTSSALSAELRLPPPSKSRKHHAFEELLPYLLETGHIKASSARLPIPGRLEFRGAGPIGEIEAALGLFVSRWKNGNTSPLHFEAARRLAIHAARSRSSHPRTQLEARFRSQMKSAVPEDHPAHIEELMHLVASEFHRWWHDVVPRSTLSVYMAGASTPVGVELNVARTLAQPVRNPPAPMRTLTPARGIAGPYEHAPRTHWRLVFKAGKLGRDGLGALLLMNELISSSDGHLTAALSKLDSVAVQTEIIVLADGPALAMTLINPSTMTSQVREQIRSTLDELTQTKLSHNEVRAGISRMLSKKAITTRSTDGHVSWLQQQASLLTPTNPTTLARNWRLAIERVTPPDLQALSRKLFIWSNRLESTSEDATSTKPKPLVSVGDSL